MGQSMKKLSSGTKGEEKKVSEIKNIIDGCYEIVFKDPQMKWVDFYHAISTAVQEINTALGNSQFRVPKRDALEVIFKKHYTGGKVSPEKFKMMLQEAILGTEFASTGSKDFLFYIFGVPLATLFIKQRFFPTTISNDIFIPGITSVTVLTLAKLNKL